MPGEEINSVPVESTAVEVTPAETVSPVPPIPTATESGDVAETSPSVESTDAPTELATGLEQSAPVEPIETLLSPGEPSTAPVADVAPVAETTIDDYTNPIDLEAAIIAGTIDCETLGLDIVQIMDVLEDCLPYCLSTTCLRERAETPQQLAAIVAEIDKANHHALVNQVSRKVRRGSSGKVNRQQSITISGAIIARALVAPVESVAACYEAVPAGSSTEE
jgi:hypothetical protein